MYNFMGPADRNHYSTATTVCFAHLVILNRLQYGL